MEGSELPEPDMNTDRLRIFATIHGLGLEVCAVRVRHADSRQWRLDGFARRADHSHLNTGHRQFGARPHNGMYRVSIQLWIRLLQECEIGRASCRERV